MTENDDIQEKLRRLGVTLGARNIEPQKKNSNYRIPDILNVTEEITSLGSIYIYEEEYPSDYTHGKILLSRMDSFDLISKWAFSEPPDSLDPESLLFLDTETSGLSHAAGTFAFLVGLGYFTNQRFKLVQIIMPEPHLEPALLEVLGRYVYRFDNIVSFNGKSFDIPLLENRHVMHRLPSPFVTKSHIDLLHLARKLWRNRLPSRRLADLEEKVLFVNRGKDEVPGWLVPELYKEYLKTGDARPLGGVFYHNAIDILSLAALFIYIANMLNQPMDLELSLLDQYAIGNLFEDIGLKENAIEIYESCIANNLPDPFFRLLIKRYASIYKKSKEFEKAIALWKLIGNRDIFVSIELAKYYEHIEKKYEEAIFWTNTAKENYKSDIENQILYDINDLDHRLSRLERKSLNDQNTRK